MSDLGMKTVEELDTALLASAKYLADMDRLGDAFAMNLQLGHHLDMTLPTPIARELIAKRQAEISAEIRSRQARIAAAATQCVCECKCGNRPQPPQGALL